MDDRSLIVAAPDSSLVRMPVAGGTTTSIPGTEAGELRQASRIIEAAWAQDEAWGTLVWLTMVTGMRRAELLALRWHDVDLAAGMLAIRRNYVWLHGRAIEPGD